MKDQMLVFKITSAYFMNEMSHFEKDLKISDQTIFQKMSVLSIIIMDYL